MAKTMIVKNTMIDGQLNQKHHNSNNIVNKLVAKAASFNFDENSVV